MLSLTKKRWIVPENDTHAHDISTFVSSLHTQRGLDEMQDRVMVTPSTYTDMPVAIERVHNAIDNGETIGIFGDYDCDGITAVAQIVRFFRRRGIEPFVRLPHRSRDGYGLHSGIMKECEDAGVTLLITADTGITAVHEIDALQTRGIDVIITDHHTVHDTLPNAFAIIHPAHSTHPLPHPSGSGVAFSFVQGLEDGYWEGMAEDTALAMMGTVADLVELKGENRALTIAGLTALNTIQRGSLHALRTQCCGTAVVSSGDVAFRIAPRINATGRIAEPDIALHALLDGGEDIVRMNQLNEERKILTLRFVDAAVESFTDVPTPEMLCRVSSQYPQGIVGLIAGRLTEQFGRPSLVAYSNGELCTASLRSPACYNIADGLKRCSHLLTRFGGHAQAAGCTFPLHNSDALFAALLEDVRAHTTPDQLHPTIQIDAEIFPQHISLDLCTQLRMLEPFGQGNAEPIFILRNVRLQNVRACGAEKTHLQCRIEGIQCIGFNLAHIASDSENYDVLVRISINEWQGKQSPQMVIIDIKKAEG